MTDLPKRLRIKASMIALGERIAWGSDTALMEEAAARLEEQAEEIQRLQADVEALRQFANEIISEIFAWGSIDGGDIQEMAVRHGLLRPEQRDEACGDACVCSEFGFPAECFRKTPMLLPNVPVGNEK